MSDRTVGDPTAPGVLVLHPWWGLTPWVERFCDRLAAEGFSVSCPDLYDGRTAATIEQAEALAAGLDGPTARARVDEAAARLAEASGGDVAALGFSMGGQLAMAASQSAPAVRAVVAFYGGSELPDGFVETTHGTAFQGHFCAFDEWEDLDAAKALFAALAATGHRAELHVYEGTDHWFMEDDRPDVYAPNAARQAFDRSVEFLRAQRS
jgi:carboxymethylenebutenolidase